MTKVTGMEMSTLFPILLKLTLIIHSLFITTFSEVPTDHDIIAAVCGHTTMDDSKDETKISTCELEGECPIVRTKEALRAISIITQYHEAHGSDETLDVILLSIEQE
jgi:hypothetical protein